MLCIVRILIVCSLNVWFTAEEQMLVELSHDFCLSIHVKMAGYSLVENR